MSKVVPSGEALENAFRRACATARLQEALDEALAKTAADEKPVMPPDLALQIDSVIKDTDKSWDEALAEIARDHVKRR